MDARHSEYLALLRRILEDPADDAPRIVYSAWLQEEAGDELRAEFVRVQLELARMSDVPQQRPHWIPVCEPAYRQWERAETLRRRELDLWSMGVSGSLDAVPDEWTITVAGHAKGEHNAFISRGFVSEVRLTCATFMGGPCGRQCWKVVGSEYTVAYESERPDASLVRCPGCHGTGRVEGLAAALFAAHPIERVTLTDREPTRLEDGGEGCAWLIQRSPSIRSGIPADLTNFLTGRDSLTNGVFIPIYPSAAHAKTDLSKACVRYARELAGLPPVP